MRPEIKNIVIVACEGLSEKNLDFAYCRKSKTLYVHEKLQLKGGGNCMSEASNTKLIISESKYLTQNVSI